MNRRKFFGLAGSAAVSLALAPLAASAKTRRVKLLEGELVTYLGHVPAVVVRRKMSAERFRGLLQSIGWREDERSGPEWEVCWRGSTPRHPRRTFYCLIDPEAYDVSGFIEAVGVGF